MSVTDDQEVANNYLANLPNLPVRSTKTALNKLIQHIRICFGTGTTESVVTLSNGLPVNIVGGSLSVSPPTLPTLQPDRVSLNNNTSTVVMAANSDRVAGAMIINNNDATFYLQIAAAAVIGQGIPLPPGATYLVNTEQQIRGIQNSGAALSLDVYESF